MGTDDLLRALFDCWAKKEEPYLNGIMEQFSNTADAPCVDGDATIWTTKLTDTPMKELAKFTCSSGWSKTKF